MGSFTVLGDASRRRGLLTVPAGFGRAWIFEIVEIVEIR